MSNDAIGECVWQREAQLADQVIARVRTLLGQAPSTRRELTDEPREVWAMMRNDHTLSFQQGVFYKDTVLSGRRVRLLVVPYSAVTRVPRYTRRGGSPG